ncbi:antA/AntB antirepressor family protein [Aeromonas rivipollensis]
MKACNELADLLPVTSKTTSKGMIPTVAAAALHEQMEIGNRLGDWTRRVIKNLGLILGLDYVKVTNLKSADLRLSSGHGGARKSVEYHFTLDTAKRIAVADRGAFGRAVWDYLMAAEKLAAEHAADLLAVETKRLSLRLEGPTHNRRAALHLKYARQQAGKESQARHYCNEASMVDAIVLGQHPKAWKRAQGLPDTAPVREHMTPEQLEILAELETTNAELMLYGTPACPDARQLDYQERKRRLAVMAPHIRRVLHGEGLE